jgi:acyl-CoA thioester hydrolase
LHNGSVTPYYKPLQQKVVVSCEARQNDVMLAHESPTAPFELHMRIKPENIDELGHVNNVVYLSWVQDVAMAHWVFLTTPAQREKFVWVAVRHEIDYMVPAVLHDDVLARTWTGTAHGLRFARHTEIIRVKDGKQLASAVTLWCPLARATGRPTRLTTEIAAFFAK